MVSTSSDSSYSGQASYASVSLWPQRSHSSSAMCGAYGDSARTNGSRAARGRVSHLEAELRNSIMAEMAVLNLISAVSFVTFLTMAAVTCARCIAPHIHPHSR